MGTIHLVPELCNFTGKSDSMKFNDLRECLFKKP